MKEDCLDIGISVLNMDKKFKLVIFLGILLIGSLIFSGSASAALPGTTPQPKYHHDNNNTGQSEYAGPQTNATKWKYTTGNYTSSCPAIGMDGTIYIGSYDHNLYAINPDGKLKWKYTTGAEIDSSPAIGTDGTIYIGSYDHNLYAINPNGKLKWKYTTNDEIHSSPAIGSDGTIYIGSNDHNLYAIKPDGTQKWNYTTNNQIKSSPAIGTDGTIYIGSSDGCLYAINPNGTKQWIVDTNVALGSAPVIGSDGTIYISTSYSNYLYAIYPNGTVKWTYNGPMWTESSPAIGNDGTIYIGSEDNNLYAINSNGTFKWKFKTGYIIFSTPTIGSDGTIYIGSGDNNLYAIKPDGTLKWKYATGSMVISSPAIGSDGTIYIGSLDNNLYAIDDISVSSSLSGGNYTNSRIVTLKTNLPGTIYYKITGSINQTNWSIYTTPLKIKNSCSLIFYAVDPNGNSTSITTETYHISYLAPVDSASLKSGTYNSKKIVTLKTVSDTNTNTYYTLDGTNPQKSSTRKLYKSPITINTTTILKYSTLDSTGKWSPNYTQKYIIDKTAPKITVTKPSKNTSKASTTTPITVKFSENIYKSSNLSKICLKNMKTGKLVKISTSIKNNTLTIKNSKLTKNTNYQLYIPKSSVKDQAGNQLNKTYTLKFKTSN